MVDGRAWQARVDGSLHPVPGDALTPYAVVTRFDPDRHLELDGPLDFDALTEQLDVPGDPAPRAPRSAWTGASRRCACARCRASSRPTRRWPTSWPSSR